MKLLTQGKPEAVADKIKNGRVVLQEPYLDVDKKVLYAANAWAAVRLPVEVEDGDTSGPVTKAALAAARKAKTDSIRADGSLSIVGNDGTATLVRPDVGQFPNIDAVTPAEYEEPFRIALNPSLLSAIADAMDAKLVVLTFSKKAPDLSAIRVTPSQFDGPAPDPKVVEGMVGILMPARIA